MKTPLAFEIYTERGIRKTPLDNKGKVLHLGCGSSKLRGAVGVDMLNLPEVDIVHNLDVLPWPFQDDSFDLVFVHSVLEHLETVPDFVREVQRVTKSGGRTIITVPYFRTVDAYTDVTHKHFFTSHSMDYFIEGKKLSEYGYVETLFREVGFWYGWPHTSPNIFVRLLKRFIHRHRRLYDQYLSLLAPVKVLIWELEVKK